MTSTRFLLAMAWRESRAARRRLVLLMTAVAVGVAALVAINSFTANLRTAIDRQAQNLLGADIRFSSGSPFAATVEEVIDSVVDDARTTACVDDSVPCPVDRADLIARMTSFDAMAYLPKGEWTRFVRVIAVDGPYPFYGTIQTDPADAWSRLQSDRWAIVDPALLTSIGAEVGDTLALGEGRFVILGTIVDIPGDVGIQTAFAPRVYIPSSAIADTKLLGFGARVSYRTYLKLASEDAADAIDDQYQERLRPERVGIRTAREAREDLSDNFGELGSFLGLVALIALLLGGLGVASAVHVFIKQKRETVAVLRCLGASALQVFAIYLVQAAVIGFLGSAFGTGLGLGIQLLLPSVLRDWLPVDVVVRPSWPTVVTGLGIGLWVALIFALLPLLSIRRITPLQALRAPFEGESRLAGWRDGWRWLAAAGLAASVVGLAVIQAAEPLEGLGFAVAIGLTLGILWLTAWLLTKAVRRWFPHRWPYVWRQGLANLYRPANQTVSLVLALGFGAFLLSTLFLVQANLLRDLRVDRGGERPNLVLFDIQPDQEAAIEDSVRVAGFPINQTVPLVPMRIRSINGQAVLAEEPPSRPDSAAGDSAAADSTARRRGWAFRREYRSTYRDTLVSSEQLIEGSWWDDTTATAGLARVSLERDIAQELGVTLGDTILWDVQGVPVETRVASIREVDWARFETNFYAVFEPRSLRDAPHMFVMLTRIEDPAARGHLQRQLAEAFPNVSSVDLALVQRTLDRIISSVITAIRFMAFFTLATGAIVLVGAVATSRFQRVREGVLLKTLGGVRSQVIRVVVGEYLALGTLAAIVALALSTVAGWALMRFVFEQRFTLPFPQLSGLAVGVVLVTVVVGVWNSTEVFRAPPLAILRAE